MSTVVEPRKKRVFIASSWADVAPIRQAMRGIDLDSSTIEEDATPGTTWIDSVRDCLHDADVVLGVLKDPLRDAHVLFELGVASALNKPTLLIVAPGYPAELLLPSGILYLTINLQDEDALRFGLRQALALLRTDRPRSSAGGFVTKPIGHRADDLLMRIADSDLGEHDLVEIVREAIDASGASMQVGDEEADPAEIDLVVWANDLEPTVGNPLLIDCKMTLTDQRWADAVLGRMLRSLRGIRNGCGLVVCRDLSRELIAAPMTPPVIFVAARDFIEGLRSMGLAELVRKLRNPIPRGY